MCRHQMRQGGGSQFFWNVPPMFKHDQMFATIAGYGLDGHAVVRVGQSGLVFEEFFQSLVFDLGEGEIFHGVGFGTGEGFLVFATRSARGFGVFAGIDEWHLFRQKRARRQRQYSL